MILVGPLQLRIFSDSVILILGTSKCKSTVNLSKARQRYKLYLNFWVFCIYKVCTVTKKAHIHISCYLLSSSFQGITSLAVKRVKVVQILWCHSRQILLFVFCPGNQSFYDGPKSSLINRDEIMNQGGSQQKPLKMALLSRTAFQITVLRVNAQFITTLTSLGWTEICSCIARVLWKTQWSIYERQNGNTNS